MKGLKLFLSIGIFCLLLVLTACNNETASSSASGDIRELRLAHIYPVGSVKDQAAHKFAKKIEKKTNGEIIIKIYPASQLGGDEVMARDISRGILDMSFINQGSLSGLDPMLDFHYLPYIVTNYEQADEIYYGDGIIPTIMERVLLEHNMVSLGFFENEFRGVSNSVKDIHSVSDLEGLKLRVPGSRTIKGFFDEAGVQTVVMPFDELYMGLQQGTVDGQDNGPMLTYDSRLHEVNSHYTLLNHVYATGTIVINKGVFGSFSEEQQEIFKEVGKEIEEWQVAENRRETEDYIKLMEEEGVSFVELTTEQIEELQQFGLDQWDKYADTYGQDNIDALKEEISNLKK